MPRRELLCRCICSCKIYVCWPCVTVTNTTAVQTCLLVKCCCKMDACWTVATQSALNQHAADLSSLNNACLLTVCFSISRACWYGVSISVVPAGMVSHYQLCLLAWCFIIGRACWCDVSLYDMSSGVVPNYRPCLLAWYLKYRPCLLVHLHFKQHFD